MRQEFEISIKALISLGFVPKRDTVKWISLGLSLFMFATTANADLPPSVRPTHPLAWMHGLPSGEQPGWSQRNWFGLEVSNNNMWNAPLTMYDTITNRKYEFTADYEQTHTVLELGHAFTNWFALSVEIPFAHRSGGMMDDFIDDYHVLIGNRRFNRQYYPENQDLFSIQTDDVEQVQTNDQGEGVSNIKLKLKFWLVQWLGDYDDSCPCGVAISSQTKFPTQPASRGGTTGEVDQSLLLHLGVPLFTESAAWITAGYTWLGDNPALEQWPRYDYSILYEGGFDFALDRGWGITLNVRAESPFLDRKRVSYFDTATDPAIVSRNRAASGWNGLLHWRGTESLGLRYKTKSGSLWHFLMSEDWGVGANDAEDGVYITNAPDVGFTLQTQFLW